MLQDTKWLEILTKNTWWTFATAVALWIFLIVSYIQGWIPDKPDTLFLITFLFTLLFTTLSVVGIVRGMTIIFDLKGRFLHYRKLKADKERIIKHLPYLTARDRLIIAFLLHHNMKTFQAEIDGEKASSLFHNGFVRLVAIPNVLYGYKDWPFVVPDHVWEILVSNIQMFPYDAADHGDDEEPLPWHKGIYE